jgi:hypothetical protein
MNNVVEYGDHGNYTKNALIKKLLQFEATSRVYLSVLCSLVPLNIICTDRFPCYFFSNVFFYQFTQ